MSKPTDITKLTFEEARDELASVVANLESGGHSLEASLALWERGELLAAHCQQWLESAREQITTAESASE
jgi:exodeoxyribonuclease VII small subunit